MLLARLFLFILFLLLSPVLALTLATGFTTGARNMREVTDRIRKATTALQSVRGKL